MSVRDTAIHSRLPSEPPPYARLHAGRFATPERAAFAAWRRPLHSFEGHFVGHVSAIGALRAVSRHDPLPLLRYVQEARGSITVHRDSFLDIVRVGGKVGRRAELLAPLAEILDTSGARALESDVIECAAQALRECFLVLQSGPRIDSVLTYLSQLQATCSITIHHASKLRRLIANEVAALG
ncbi:hypothetical protein [Caballeronia sp. LZ032]|uniref:hypothetical protein n=1 Tax=Caballeronia sp. LZ032 TaxID=3038565 RepID=UPI002865B0B1|nr:hypothetical protein [Caballeronia sp. LZ032]MDR5884320.1 hypothetical protein [Caballeronia sp. LZ032]